MTNEKYESKTLLILIKHTLAFAKPALKSRSYKSLSKILDEVIAYYYEKKLAK